MNTLAPQQPHVQSQDRIVRADAPVLLLISFVCLSCTACSTQVVRIEQSLTATLAGNEAETQMDFWHDLYERKLTSNDDAFHGTLLFLDGEDKAENYLARVKLLKSKGLLPDDFIQPSNQAVQRGTTAIIIYHALNIKGGTIATLFPYSPRYTLRELQYLRIYPQSSERQTLTGGEFVSLLGRVDDYRNGQPVEQRAANPPKETIRPQDKQPQPNN